MTDQNLSVIAKDILSVIFLMRNKLLEPDIHYPKKNFIATHHFVLLVLKEHGKMPLSELGRRVQISKSNMTVIIDKLSDDGYVNRISDDRDKRVTNVELTSEGRNLLSSFEEGMINNLKNKLSNLRETEISTLFTALSEVKNIISKLI